MFWQLQPRRRQNRRPPQAHLRARKKFPSRVTKRIAAAFYPRHHWPQPTPRPPPRRITSLSRRKSANDFMSLRANYACAASTDRRSTSRTSATCKTSCMRSFASILMTSARTSGPRLIAMALPAPPISSITIDSAIVVKKTRTGLSRKDLADQVRADVERYRNRGRCAHLLCFIYDPEGRIGNPRGLESELCTTSEHFAVDVVVAPK